MKTTIIKSKLAIAYCLLSIARCLFVFNCLLPLPPAAFSQGIGINTTGAAPDASALLDIDGTNGGLLIPRMTTVQRDGIPAACSCTPADGLQIINTTETCLQIYFGGTWQNIFCGCTAAPGAAGIITGSTPVCQNQNGVSYSITAITGATGYVWTYTGTGFTIASGNNTNAITANFSATSTSGNLTVYATNACGNGTSSPAYPITVSSSPVIFSYTGAIQIFTVPPCVTSITIEALGGQGGYSVGGLGGRATATFPVTPNDTLYIYVGGDGSSPSLGWNGGGSGLFSGNIIAFGGGASDVRVAPYGLSDRIIVAGGGGSGADYNGADYSGAGGGTVGGNGGDGTTGAFGGSGGTQVVGGAGGNGACGGGNGSNGSFGNGGNGGNGVAGNNGWGGGGGGGGGYYGGGGGGGGNLSGPCGGGDGGGGSGYTGTGTSASMATGVQSGNGQVTITW